MFRRKSGGGGFGGGADPETMQKLSAASLLRDIMLQMDKNFTDAMASGESFFTDNIKKNGLVADLKKFTQAIIITSGNMSTCALLVRSVNQLLRELNDKYPYPELLTVLLERCYEAFNYAVLGNFGRWNLIVQAESLSVMEKTNLITNEAIISKRVTDKLKDVRRDIDERKNDFRDSERKKKKKGKDEEEDDDEEEDEH